MWAADGRQRADWTRSAVSAAVVANKIAQVWGGEAVDAADLIPDRYRPPKPKAVPLTPEQRQRETRSAVALLGAFLGDKDPFG